MVRVILGGADRWLQRASIRIYHRQWTAFPALLLRSILTRRAEPVALSESARTETSMFFEVLSLTYHSPITIAVLTCDERSR